MNAYVRLALGGFLLPVLTACGFHLVGSRPLPEPLQRVEIDMITPYSVTEPPLETALRARLARRGAKVVESADAGVTRIKLSKLDETREVLSVSADGQPLEYLLRSRVTYEVVAGPKQLIAPDQLSVSRDYSFSVTQILPKESEEQRLRQFMQDELAEMILLRLEGRLNAMAGVPGITPAEGPRTIEGPGGSAPLPPAEGDSPGSTPH